MDLVRQKEAWKRGVKEIRTVFANLEAEFRRDLQSAWRVHWDHQLYKALEYQYHRGLETLNDMLPQMSVSLVFKQRRLQFDPPLEEIRTDALQAGEGLPEPPPRLQGRQRREREARVLPRDGGLAGRRRRVREGVRENRSALRQARGRAEAVRGLGRARHRRPRRVRRGALYADSKDFEDGFTAREDGDRSMADRIPLEIKGRLLHRFRA